MKRRFKVSRKSFIGNYITSASILILMILLQFIFGLQDIVFLLMIILGLYFLLEPEYSLIYMSYEITDDKLTQEKGILMKKTEMIPWRQVSKIEMKQGIFGRIFGYGDIFVSDVSEAPGITIRGVSNPKKVLGKIEEKIDNINIKAG